METFLMLLIIIAVIALYIIPGIICWAYYFSLIVQYQGLSLGRAIRAGIITIMPVMNFVASSSVIGDIFRDLSEEYTLERALNQKGPRKKDASLFEAQRYYGQEHRVVKTTFLCLYTVSLFVKGVFDTKLIRKR